MNDALCIYDAYPRKVGRRKALLEIERAIRRLQNGECGQKLTYEEAAAGLLKATTAFANSPACQHFPYVPHPTTWFHQGRYLDDPGEWTNGKVNGESKDAALARKNGDVLDRMREKESAPSESGTLIFERADRRIDSPVGQHPRKLFGRGVCLRDG